MKSARAATKHSVTRFLPKAGFVVLALALSGASCGGEQDGEPSGAGAQVDTETQALVDPTAGASMDGDMVAMPGDEIERVQGALTDAEKAGDPKVIYLFYADGKDLPDTDIDACKGTPPKFNCTFAPTLAECQRQIQSYLDRWYADFNVIFTLTRPTSEFHVT